MPSIKTKIDDFTARDLTLLMKNKQVMELFAYIQTLPCSYDSKTRIEQRKLIREKTVLLAKEGCQERLQEPWFAKAQKGRIYEKCKILLETNKIIK